MKDPRMTSLAQLLVSYSCALERDEKVLIECFDIPEDFTVELIREVRKAGGVPFVSTKHNRIMRSLYENATEEQMRGLGAIELFRMQKMKAYIGVRGSNNIAEMSDVPQEKLKLVNAHYFKPVHLEQRVKRSKWVVLRWPTPSMAQQAEMSTEAFEDFFFRVCTLDYPKMSKAMDSLVEWLDKTDRVRITGPGTELTFSIKEIPIRKCDGRRNIPDGEVFTAPVRDSINGAIQFNAPTIYQGSSFSNIRLAFKDGRVIEATGGSREETDKLNTILDSDEGARYTGEFAIGLNPYITRAMKDILFDEKISGSIHLTPGQAYEEADNGNRSQIHWDMVLIQTKEYGGGEIYLDDRLIRKDGLFVVPELEGLNPEQLK
jgi:aminopeptidase